MIMTQTEKIREIIGKFEDYYTVSHSYIPLQSNKIDFSEEEKEIVYDHPELFFQASKSRILLVVWLCKILRNTFELYGYSDLDMPNETYEILRTNFKTKAFNRANYLSLFKCSNSNILSYNQFVDIEQKYISEYNQYVEPAHKLSLMPHISIRKTPETVLYSKELANIFSSKRNTDIIYLRSQGKTLDEIGETLGITRERARQLEFKPKNNIERWLATREKDIIAKLTSKNLINQQKARKELGEREWQIIKYVITSNNKTNKLNWKYYEPFDLVYYSKDLRLEESFEEIKEKLKAKKINNLITEFTKELIDKGYIFWSEDMTAKNLRLNNYNIYNQQLHEGKMTIGKSIGIVAKNYFPQGVKVTDKKELNSFADKINEIFGLEVSAKRALLTRIQDTLLMSDKGKYISPEFLIFDESLLNSIETYVNSMRDERITYESLFNIFEKELKEKTSIDNHYYLHGALKYLTSKNKANLLCYRYYVGKGETEKTKSEEFFRIFYDYLKEQSKPQTVSELLKVFPSWNEMYFRYSTMYFPAIAQWEKNVYVCLDSIGLTEEDKKYIVNVIEKLMDNEINYTSSYAIYNYISSNNPDLLKKIKIDNEGKMYHIIQYLVGNKYYCRRPHILKEWDKSHFSAQDLISLVLDRKEIVSKPEAMKELIALYGSKNSSLNLSLQKELQNYIKIGTFEYVKKSKINLNKKDLDLITNIIKNNMIKGEVLLPNTITDFSEYPKIKYDWSPWILCGVVNAFDLDFKLVGNPNTPSQNTMTIILKTNSELNSKSDVFNWLLKNDYDGDDSISNIFKYAKKTGIFHTNLTLEDIKNIIGG